LNKSITDNGLTTIEEVRKIFNNDYNGCCLTTKLQLKAWLYHSESRNKNGNKPFEFYNYTEKMNDKYYLEQVKLNIIDCSDLGGKELVENHLLWRINN